MKKYLILIAFVLIALYGYSQNYNNIVNYYINGTPTHGAKIKTNLPFGNSNHMPTLSIKGYAYNIPATIDLSLSWYIGNNNFVQTTMSSSGGITPDVWLAEENGKVVIFLDLKIHFQRFTVSAYSMGLSERPEYFEGWSVVDEPLSGTRKTYVTYKNYFGGIFTTGNVFIGENDETKDDGSRLYLRGAKNNSDHLWLAKHIRGNDLTDLRVNIGDYANGDRFVIGTDQSDGSWKEFFAVSSLDKGRVGIGVSFPTCALEVNGTIRAKEVKIEAIGWSDFVFDKDYKLPSLQSVEQHINEKQHLPDMPSEKQVLEEGVNVVEMQAKLLQKIEELTLYVIEQDKENKELKKQMNELKDENNYIKEQLLK